MKNLFRFGLIAALTSLFVIQCGPQEETTPFEELPDLSQQQIDSIRQVVQDAPREPVMENEVGVIETNYGTIIVEFFTDVAPIHSENFKLLADNGYYDGTWFHRIIPGFMIQGGDILSRDNNPANDGTGGPGYTIQAEFSRTPHYRGRLSMARSSDPNSAGSQFFIVQNPTLTEEQIRAAQDRVGYEFSDEVVQNYLEQGGTPMLDNQYTVFGEVISGMDVVDRIAEVQTNQNDRPVDPVVMTDVYITERSEVAL